MARIAEHYRASGKAANKKWRRFALGALFVLAAALFLQMLLRQLLFFPLRITSDSMAPEIQSGDKRYFIYSKLSPAALGDIVLVESPRADVEYLCRVVATDGDKVKIDAGKFIVNGTLKKELKPRIMSVVDRSFSMQEIEIRPNYVFCLNENEQNTNDSRLHGSFERRRIIARLIKPTLFF